MALISGLAHVNLTVPPGTLDQAAEFYGKTLGLTQSPVPQLQRDRLAWYVHISPPKSSHGQDQISISCPPSTPLYPTVSSDIHPQILPNIFHPIFNPKHQPNPSGKKNPLK